MLFKGNSSRLEFLIEKIQAHKESSPSPVPDEKCSVSRSKVGSLSNGGYAWRTSEDDSFNYQRGGGTPSSCATSTSMSFVSEPEAEVDLRMNVDSINSSGPYPCQFCDKSYPSLSYLKKHEQSHGDQMPYRCSWCARLFKHKRSRDRHVKLHTGDRRYRCTQCEAAFSRSDHLKIHMKTHDNQKPYHCSECSRGYNTAAALTSHMQSHKRPQSTSTINQNSSKLVSENRRSSSWHSSASSPTISSPLLATSLSQKIQPSYSPDPGGSFLRSSLTLACMYCARDTFTSMEQLQVHVETTHEAILNRNSPSLSKKNRNDRQTPENILTSDHHDSLTLTCPLCGMPCSSAAHYAEHYVLEHCNNRSIINRLSKHGKSASETHESTRQSETPQASDIKYSSTTLLCGQCGAALQDFESFRAHVARHLQANQRQKYIGISCPKCELTFQARDDMLSHLIKHFLGQEVKQYGCEACNQVFNHSELLDKHLMDAHAQQIYRCAICRDTFESRVAIQVHFSVKHKQETTVYHCSNCRDSQKEKSRENNGLKDCEENVFVFKNSTEMMEHVVNVHTSELARANEDREDDDDEDISLPGNAVSTPRIIGELFRCCFCGVFCTSDMDLQRHLASHSSCLYRCPICHEGFPVEFLLDQHITHSHNVVDGDGDGDEATANQKVYCRPRSQGDSVQHKRRYSPDTNSNQLDNTKRSMFRPISSLVAASQRCDLCDRSDFSTEAELGAHKKLIHKSPAKLHTKHLCIQVCNYCGETMKSRLDLETHTRLHHAFNDSGKRYKCNICDEIFSSNILLAEHKLQQHCKVQLSNVCIVCRGVLTSEFDFMQHVQKHNLEAIDPQQRLDNMLSHVPAQCVVCRQTLISELECQLHAKYHLRPSSEENQSSQELQNCCICLREFLDDEDVVSLSSYSVSMSDQKLKVCKRCCNRHSRGLPILGSPYNGTCENKEASTSEEIIKTSIKCEEDDALATTVEHKKIVETLENHAPEKKAEVGKHPYYFCHHCPLKFSFAKELERHLADAIHRDKKAIFPVKVQQEVSLSQTGNNHSLDNVIVKEEIIVNTEEDEDELSNESVNVQMNQEVSEHEYHAEMTIAAGN